MGEGFGSESGRWRLAEAGATAPEYISPACGHRIARAATRGASGSIPSARRTQMITFSAGISIQ
jgi:hypothetical protein